MGDGPEARLRTRRNRVPGGSHALDVGAGRDHVSPVVDELEERILVVALARQDRAEHAPLDFRVGGCRFVVLSASSMPRISRLRCAPTSPAELTTSITRTSAVASSVSLDRTVANLDHPAAGSTHHSSAASR